MNQDRLQTLNLSQHFATYKQALVLLGARQVGKTTLLKKVFPRALYLLVDEKRIQQALESYDSSVYRTLIGEAQQVILDELHLLSNPGRAAKLIYDQLPGVQLIITGSSSLHIKNKTAESMAGRAIDYNLYPLTFWEYLRQNEIEHAEPIYLFSKIIAQDSSPTVKAYSHQDLLEQVLIFGLYPELLGLQEKKLYLKNLINRAIFKDIIDLNLIENQGKALALLKLLSYQIGNLISYAELANKLDISIPTVQRYIQIFEDSFILYRIYPFSQKGRDEIIKAPKIYFWDLGVRNALIENFADMQSRHDTGALFENFVFSELKKEISYLNLDYKLYYWRLKSGSEVDLVLSHNGEIIACEIKLHKGQVATAFRNHYPKAKTHLLTMENFW